MNEDILQNVNRRIDDALEYSRQLVEDDEMAKRIDDIKSQTELYIRRNPLKSVAFGLLAGYTIGKIFSSED